MTGYGFTFAEVAEIARGLGIGAIGDDLRPGRGGVVRCSFRLALDSTRPLGDRPYQRVSMSRLNGDRPRRVAAVCFHGHRDVFRALFERHPAARIVSARARYDGREHFEASYHAQAAGEASPYGYFTSYADACECDDVTRSDDGHRVEFGTLDAELGRLVRTRTIANSAILACPHVILAPEHYGDDGRCRCSDPVEQARLISEYGYTRADFEAVR